MVWSGKTDDAMVFNFMKQPVKFVVFRVGMPIKIYNNETRLNKL